MAARLATQRTFIKNTSQDTMTSPTKTQNGEILTTSNGQTTTIPLQHVLQQKKIILQTRSNSGVSMIDVLPIENSDSSNESPLTVQVKDDIDNSNSNGEQQVTAQVAVVHAQSPIDGTPHYITVTAEGAVRSYAPITTVVSSQDSVPPHSYHVQYVDSDLYSATGQAQTQMAYPVYTVGDYSTNGQQYYASSGNYGSSSSNNSSSTYSIVPVDETILASQPNDSPQSISAEVAYIQGPQSGSNANNISVPETESTPNLSHATRVSPATVAWLLENYETAEGVSLPRSTLYNHYMRHCNENKLDAVNAASFGKLIRSVFTGLRTRRLGTRGNSKYHYYGIRVKPGSHLMSALDEKQPQNGGATSNSNNINNSSVSRINRKTGSKPETYEACSQYLGDGSRAIPLFPSIDITQPFPDEITLEDVDTLRSIYREHCEAFLDAILNLEFSTVESLWREFWRAQDNNNGDECEEEKYLSKSKLYMLCQCDSIQNFIRQVDLAFYQNMVEVLIPDVLRPIPSSLTQAIRNFSKNLDNWLTTAMAGCPDKIIQIKLSSVQAFGQTLRRYTSLNHLAQAARAVLQNSSQIAQMLNDLNRVDFHNVHEQASWVCQCDTNTVQRLVNDFKAALQQQNSLEQWASWLRLVVDSALEEYQGKPSYATAARQFLLKWSFYSSMVIRDLTLRSAASFGSFHLIRLLYDEYMFFIVEHKVAQATGTKPIAVMGEFNKISLPFQHPDDMHQHDNLMFPNELHLKIEPETKRMRS